MYSFLVDNGLVLFKILTDSKFSPALSLLVCIIPCIIVPYLLGSLNFGIIWSKLLFKDDVRSHGSGNAGSTNMLRNYGKKAAVMTLVGDALKTVISCYIGAFLYGSVGVALAGLFCMMGHMFPIYYKFKGGKGIVCLAMLVLMTDFRVFLFLLFVFVVIVAGTKYVSLGSVIGAMLYPIVLNRLNNGTRTIELFAILVAALIVFMHRENIKRLFKGTENKLSFKSKKSADMTDTSEEE